jgi:hypothetical protein
MGSCQSGWLLNRGLRTRRARLRPRNEYIRKWTAPNWGFRGLNEVKDVGVEEWLSGLDLAPGSRKKIRDIIAPLYEDAIRLEQIDNNTISKVRQGGKACGSTTNNCVASRARVTI